MWFEKFFFPKLDWKFGVRLCIIAVTVWCIGSFWLMPCFINGRSMQPTYDSVGFNLCNKLKYRKSGVKHGDIVVLRYVDNKYFLKRVIALEGETVEFRKGKLFRNGAVVEEEYVKLPCDWDMMPVTVRKGTIFVVGDNRSMPISQHQFGMISTVRITGAPLW